MKQHLVSRPLLRIFDGATTLLTASGWAIPKRVDFLCVSETKVIEPLRLNPGAKVPKVGSVNSQCRITAKGAHSGGVGILWDPARHVTPIDALLTPALRPKGAAIGAICGAMIRTRKYSFLLLSTYFYVGQDFGGDNIHIMFCLSKILTFFQFPFIICWGFNITSDAMETSPWLTEIGGAVWATTKPTCTAGQIGSVIDYAIISTGMARSIKGISVSPGPSAPHLAVFC